MRELARFVEARVDRWRMLNRVAKGLASSDRLSVERLRSEAMSLLSELAALEELNAYPGPHLMAEVAGRLRTAN